MSRHPNHATVVAALTAEPERLIEWAADALILLGAKSEWSMEDNFGTTETLARLASAYGLPPAGDQDDEALRFYGEAAQALGYESDLDEMDEDEEEEEE